MSSLLLQGVGPCLQRVTTTLINGAPTTTPEIRPVSVPIWPTVRTPWETRIGGRTRRWTERARQRPFQVLGGGAGDEEDRAPPRRYGFSRTGAAPRDRVGTLGRRKTALRPEREIRSASDAHEQKLQKLRYKQQLSMHELANQRDLAMQAQRDEHAQALREIDKAERIAVQIESNQFA